MKNKISKAQSEVWEWKEAVYEAAEGRTVEEKLQNLLQEPNPTYEALLKLKTINFENLQHESIAQIELFKDQMDKYYFRLITEDNEIIFTSNTYENKSACKEAAQKLIDSAQYARVIEIS